MKILSKNVLNGTFFFALSAVSIITDQLSKGWIRAFLESKPGRELQLIPGFATLVYRFNTGGAFSIYDNTPSLFIYLPLLLSAALLALLIVYIRQGGGLPAAGIALMLGGATGNLIDRIRDGKVFDFMDCYIGNLHWPAFNVADSCICIGMFLFIVSFIKEEKCKTAENCDKKS